MPEVVSERVSRTGVKNERSERALTKSEKEVRGEWEAVQLVDRLAENKRMPIGEETIIKIHSKILRYFHSDISGKYRESEAKIIGANFLPTHPSKIRIEMLEFGRQLEERTKNFDQTFEGISNIINTAAWAHYKFVRVHPFYEGNGRTARLLADIIMKRGGLYYVTDWGKADVYKEKLKRVDESSDLGHFERFLAFRLALRYEEETRKLIRNGSASEVNSPVLGDLIKKKQWLLRISSPREPVVSASQ